MSVRRCGDKNNLYAAVWLGEGTYGRSIDSNCEARRLTLEGVSETCRVRLKELAG